VEERERVDRKAMEKEMDIENEVVLS